MIEPSNPPTVGPDGRPATTIRRPGPGDLDRLGEFVEAARGRHDFEPSSDPEASFLVEYARSTPDAVAVALAPDDSVVGLISPEFKTIVVAPAWRRRGVGGALVEAGLAIERDRGRAELILGLTPEDSGGRSFLTATGFGYHSTLFELALPTGAASPPPKWPAAVVARPFDRDRDVAPFLETFNTAFAEHATPLQMTEAGLRASFDDPRLRDEDVLVLEAAGGELVGLCATVPARASGMEGHDDVGLIGVLPAWRGRGLGRQLLAWAVAYLRGLGAGDVWLGVNERNDGALRLYESAGFERRTTRERWARAA